MLLRIYDIILTEGASETLMRVALSLMRRNKDKIMECTELEGMLPSAPLIFANSSAATCVFRHTV